MIHDNCQLPCAFLSSYKSIPPSIRYNYGLSHSIAFVRQTDSLTESINQQSLEKLHNTHTRYIFLKTNTGFRNKNTATVADILLCFGGLHVAVFL